MIVYDHTDLKSLFIFLNIHGKVCSWQNVFNHKSCITSETNSILILSTVYCMYFIYAVLMINCAMTLHE